MEIYYRTIFLTALAVAVVTSINVILQLALTDYTNTQYKPEDVLLATISNWKCTTIVQKSIECFKPQCWEWNVFQCEILIALNRKTLGCLVKAGCFNSFLLHSQINLEHVARWQTHLNSFCKLVVPPHWCINMMAEHDPETQTAGTVFGFVLERWTLWLEECITKNWCSINTALICCRSLILLVKF